MTYQIKNGKQDPIIAVDCHYKKKKIFLNMMIKNDNINTSSSIHKIFQNLLQISVTELIDMEIVEIDNGLNKKKDIVLLLFIIFKI